VIRTGSFSPQENDVFGVRETVEYCALGTCNALVSTYCQPTDSGSRHHKHDARAMRVEGNKNSRMQAPKQELTKGYSRVLLE